MDSSNVQFGKITRKRGNFCSSSSTKDCLRYDGVFFWSDWFFLRSKVAQRKTENRSKKVFLTDASFASFRWASFAKVLLAFLLESWKWDFCYERDIETRFLVRYTNKVARRTTRSQTQPWIKRLNKNYRFVFILLPEDTLRTIKNILAS